MVRVKQCCRALAIRLAAEYKSDAMDVVCESVATAPTKCKCGTFVKIEFSTRDDE